MNWIDELTPKQRGRWTGLSRKPFHLFNTTEEELAVPSGFWRSRTPGERMEYLNHTRRVIYGEAAMNAPFVRCYGWRKSIKDEYDPKDVVYF